MENHNTYEGLSGVALWQLLSRSIPKEALRRLSVQEYEKDEDWVAALREVTRREEIFNEELSLRHDPGSGSKESGGGKRKREESKATTKSKRQRKEYTTEEKVAYKLKKENERKGKGNAPVKGKIINTDWKMADNGIRESVTNNRKNAQQCTRGGMNIHTWSYCFKPIQVSAIGARRPFRNKPTHSNPREWKKSPITPSRRPRTATVSRQRPIEEETRVNQIDRPLAWDFDDMETT